MGFLTLRDMQQEVAEMVSPKGPGERRGNERLTRLINLGYYELTGSQDFKALFTLQTIPTVATTIKYTFSTNLQSMRSVVDTTNKKNLRRLEIENFFRLDSATTGIPNRWARAGGELYLWPTPDAVYSINLYYHKEPVKLVLDGDTTVLLGMWDQAIILLAAKSAALFDGDTQKADGFLAAARLYIQTRIQDVDSDRAAQSVGITIARSESDLLNQRQ